MSNIQQFYYKKSRLQQLKGFCYTFQLGSARKASEKMGLDPSTITVQIKSLEKDLNVKLFKKEGNKLIPTKKGKLLYEMSIGYIYGIDNIMNKFIETLSANETGTLNIAAHHIFMSHVLPKYLKIFFDLYPNIKITLHNLTIEEAVQNLRDDKIDLAMYPMSEIPDWCDFKPIFTYDPVLIVSKESPLAKKKNYTLKDLESYNLVRVSSDVVTMPGFEELVMKNTFKNTIFLKRGTWEMLIGLVKANIGFTFMHTLFLGERDHKLVIKPASKYLSKITYGLITKKGKVFTNYVNEFLDIMDKH